MLMMLLDPDRPVMVRMIAGVHEDFLDAGSATVGR